MAKITIDQDVQWFEGVARAGGVTAGALMSAVLSTCVRDFKAIPAKPGQRGLQVIEGGR